MRIGILGAGHMAAALGGGWAAAGHDVHIGARDAAKAEALAQRLGPRAAAGTPREAAAFGDAVLLAVPASAVADILAAAGAADGVLDGRTLIDCGNAFAPDEAAPDGPPAFVLAEDALAERVAGLVPGAHDVKAFNVCAAEVWQAPVRTFDDRPLAVPLCGSDPHAVKQVAALAADLGLRPVEAGGLGRARYLEALAVFVV
ncbi:MAG: NAD(P)-binding domain-containing protein, partial [Streptomycetaceae bacterium]|nr:NAD(P)-binding domain-containing protein [Streptomycetaceae bacterium]